MALKTSFIIEKKNYIHFLTVVELLVVSFTTVYLRFNKIADMDKVALQEVICLIQ